MKINILSFGALLDSIGNCGKIISANVPVAQRIRAFACGAKGRAFESPQGRLHLAVKIK